jgi:DHA3 family macrolide efflux protein-like MFS transporter
VQHIEQHQPQWQTTFFSIWTGQQLSLVGSSLAQFALVWWLTETTGSATVLATGTLISLLPNVFLGPFVGALVDRWNRRRVMIVADGLIALVSAWLAYLFWAGAIRVGHVYVIMLARAIGGTFHWPAMQASTSLMVPDKHLSRVAGLNQTMQGVLSIVSPPLGALLLGVLALHAIMAIDVVTAAFAIVPLFFVHIPQPQRRAGAAAAGGSKPSLWADVREGLSYIWHQRGLFAIVCIAAVVNFFLWPAFSLVPILVTGHFGGQALELGWMNSAWGIGLVLGGLVLSAWGGFRRRILTSLIGLIGMGLGTLAVGLTPTAVFWLGVVGLFLAAFMMAICNGPVFALLQALVAPEMQARVFTVIQSSSAAMAPLGMAFAGPVADAFGVRIWYVMGGVACILMGAGAFFVPAIMHLEDAHGIHPPPSPP